MYTNERVSLARILSGVAVVSLFATVTNFVPLSAMTALFVPFALLTQRIPRVLMSLWLYLSISLVSVIFYYPESLASYDFYRRDGNIFISYAPLMVLPLFACRVDLLRLLKAWIFWVTSLYLVLLVLWIIRRDTETFGGLFYARNAVGGFLALAACVTYALARGYKRIYLVPLLIIVAGLVSTYSRGSILGWLMAVLLCEWHIRAGSKRLRRVATYFVFAVALGLTYYIGFINMDTYERYLARGDLYIGEAETGKDANIFIRTHGLWPQAVYAFQASPVLGIGFGAFDDMPLNLEGHDHVLSYNVQDNKRHSDSHAHNSYLHILAEQGLLGFTVIAVLLVNLYRFLDRKPQGPRSAVELALLASLFSIVFSSFTEHRLFTPSMVLPFSLILGLYISNHRARSRYRPVTRFDVQRTPERDSYFPAQQSGPPC